MSTADTRDEMLAMIREALAFHIAALIEDGDPVPEPTMSIDDSIAYHSQALSEADEELLAEYGDAPQTLSTRFELVEIEVPAPQPLGCRVFYDRRRAGGDLHHQALRALGNRLVGYLHGCLRNHTLHEEDTAWGHRPARKQLAA